MTLPLYERTENAAKLADANEVLLSVADTLGERVDRLEKLRALYGGPLDDPAKAYRASLALFELDPSELPNREALLGFATAAGVTGELSDKLRAAAGTTQDRNLRRDLLVVVAELEEKQPGRAPEAEKVYAQILAAEPMHVGAFRALARLYKEGQRWPELRALLDARQLAALDARERLDLLAQIAELDEASLADPEHALEAYEKMLELDPSDLRAHRALERLYAARERWTDLEALLGTRVGFASETEVPELEFRRADLRAGRLDNVAGALDLLEGIVEAAPNHEGARRLLEKLLADPGPAPARRPDPGAGLREERRLGPPGRHLRGSARGAAGDGGGGAAGARGRPAGEQAAGAGRGAHHLASGAGGRRGAPRRAPGDRAAGDDAGAVLRAGRRLSGAGVPSRRLRHQRPRRSAVPRGAALRRSAQQPARRHRRLEAGPQPRSEQPRHRRAGRGGAGGALRRDQRRRQPGQDAAAAGAAGPTARRRARRSCSASPAWKRSRSATPRRRWPRCAPSWSSTRRTRPPSTRSIGSSRRGPTTASGWRSSASGSASSGDAAARQELWRSVANLLEKDVGDVDEAIAACVSILDENPEDDQALGTLARLYEQQGRHRDRLEIVERRLALRKPKDAERLALLKQLAKLLEGPLGDATGALERWREVLERAPGRRGGAGGAGAFPGAGHRRRACAWPPRRCSSRSTKRAVATPSWRASFASTSRREADVRARLGELMRLAALRRDAAR